MIWIDKAQAFAQAKQVFVVATIISVKGHAPRNAGCKMLISTDETHSSIGGGNLEQMVIDKAKLRLRDNVDIPEVLSFTLGTQGGSYGVQCCGGEVRVLLETVNLLRPHIAIFGAGHVGWALANVLGTLPLDISLIDSRKQIKRKIPLELNARLALYHVEIPETKIADLAKGSHLIILSHDHAEDLAILDVALKRKDFGYIGLIGSRTKWQRFLKQLKSSGHSDEDLHRVTCPIGLKTIQGKSPEVIAIATAAQLMPYLDLP